MPEALPLATWSPCKRYRYTLRRLLPVVGRRPIQERVIAWILLNPSTATETEDDPTIRRVQNFSRAWGYTEAAIVNVYAYRSTDPRGMREVADPIGPENDAAILSTCARAETVVAAWGVHAGPKRAAEVHSLARHADPRGVFPREVFCLGTTKSGAPRHPLYLPSATTPIRFEV